MGATKSATRFPSVELRPAALILLFASAILLGSLARAAAADRNGDNDQCGLYLAVSSTTGDYTVWGIYAGKNYKKGEVVGSPDLAVNTLNLRANNVLDEDAPEDVQERLLRTVEFLEESFWVPDAVGG